VTLVATAPFFYQPSLQPGCSSFDTPMLVATMSVFFFVALVAACRFFFFFNSILVAAGSVFTSCSFR